jgi:hypothetical protein
MSVENVGQAEAMVAFMASQQSEVVLRMQTRRY